MKKQFKNLFLFLLSYSILIALTIGLKFLHQQSINISYYIILSSIIIPMFIFLNFTNGIQIEKLLPKNSTFAFIIVLARRFLPLSLMKVNRIKDNQKMRGAKFKGISQFRNYTSLLIPGIIATLIWSDHLTENITMRTGGKNEFKQKN